MRLRKIQNAGIRLQEHPELVIFHPEEHFGKWSELFGNDHSIHLEIGMGKGKFLIGMAKAHPEVNFVGIELFDSVIVKAMEKVIESGLSNIRLINTDGANLLSIFKPLEVTKLYLNFSDPWPKSRHTKRRLTYDTFLKTYQTLLEGQGEIELKTDNTKLFEYSVVNFNHHQMEFLDFSVDLHKREENIITTEYEDKFVAMNKPIYYVKVRFKE